MDKEIRINRLLNIFISDMLKNQTSGSAGWKGVSVLALLMDYEGFIPKFTGGDQSNMTMIIAIEGMGRTHPELLKIKTVVYELLGDERHNQKILALLSKQFYRGLYEPTGKEFTDADRLAEIGFQVPESGPERAKALQRYKDRIKAAYDVLDAELMKFDRYAGAA